MIGGYEAGELNDALESIQKHIQNDRVSMSGEVVGTDDDGTVWVHVLGGVEATPVEASAVEVEPGDIVDVTIGNGTARVLSNLSQPSASVDSVRRVERAASEAGKSSALAMQVATEADRVATATGQHFWHDDNGGHVTDVEQADYLAAEAAGFPDWDPENKPWYALLLNSLGLLLKTGARYLASFTQSAVTFFDGQGNGAENVVASFGADGAQIGRSGEVHLEQTASGISIVDENGEAGLLLRYDEYGEAFISTDSRALEIGDTGLTTTSIAAGEMVVIESNIVTIKGIDGASISWANSNRWASVNCNEDGVTASADGRDIVLDTEHFIYEPGTGKQLVSVGSVRGNGAENLTGRNFSPFFAHDLTDRSYWYNGQAVTNLLNATSYKVDGWAHVSIPATSANTQYNIRITEDAIDAAYRLGNRNDDFVTLLVEIENVTTSGTTSGKMVQPANMTGELIQLEGAQDLDAGKHWFDGAFTGTGGEGLCLQLWSGTVACEFDVRVSLYMGKYRGAYKPYVLPEAELLTVKSTTELADIATAGTYFGLVSGQYASYGKTAQLTLYITSFDELTAGTSYTVATLASGKRPLVNPSTASLGTTTAVRGAVQVNANGNVLFRPSANIASSTSFRINAAYILA